MVNSTFISIGLHILFILVAYYGLPSFKIKESIEADIIGVKGNPLEDITSLEAVEFVMNNGIVIKQ